MPRALSVHKALLESLLVLHGLKNASAYFQSTIPPLLDHIKKEIKVWIDDFTTHAKFEQALLRYLK